MQASQLKSTLKSGRPVFGMMLHATEGMRWGRALRGMLLDYVVIDAEHGSLDRKDIAALSIMCREAGITPIARVADPDPVLVAIALDAGADGVLVPYCENAEEVRLCAWKAKLHPMKGKAFENAMKRGEFPSGRAQEYIANRHANHLFIMGVESQYGVDSLDELLDCAPMDGVFVGPNDLTTSMGIPDDVFDSKYLAVLRTIVEKSEARGIPVMIHHQYLEESLKSSLGVGSRFILHGSDVSLLRQAIARDFTKIREEAAKRWGGNAPSRRIRRDGGDITAEGQGAELYEKIRNLRDVLLEGLVERDVIVRLALLAALAGEHILLLGPPGTAKSLVARRLKFAFAKATYFERLLTRFTVPEELFGPLSIKGLEEDRYERLTDSYLPTASVAFLDEIFKANSAILNALLTLLNEREFDNGAKREKTPLVSTVGASNELPESQDLDALYDRFLLRVHLGPVSKEGFNSLLGLRGNDMPTVANSLQMSTEDLESVQRDAEQVEVPDDVLALMGEMREWCAAEEIPVSDRRWRKILKLLQVAALTNGRECVSIWDCWLLQHCIWSDPEEREKVYQWYTTKVGASAKIDNSKIVLLTEVWETKLKKDQGAQTHRHNAKGEPTL